MTSIEELEKQELENLTEEEELVDLESLIREGADAKIAIVFDYPREDKVVKTTALLKPLTNSEVNNARRVASKVSDTTFEIELLKRGLYHKNGDLFNPELIGEMYAGVVAGLVEKLMEISGVKADKKEQMEFAKELMGF